MAETTWNYTLQDFSPLFVYSSSPTNGNSQVSNLDPAWNQNCPFEPAGPLNNALCDVSSVHTTNVVNATVSLTFSGQGVQLFGSVTNDVKYNVYVDGSVIQGQPSNDVLATVSGLEEGDHTVSLTIASASSGTLSLAGAQVTVGTGLTGATVTRTVVQDTSPLIHYVGGWSTVQADEWNITHTPDNGTWHQLSYTQAGSLNLSLSGSAVLVYGVSWSFFPTKYRMTIGTHTPFFLSSSSTLPSTPHGRVYTNGLLFAQSHNLSSDTLTFDNENGAGQIGLDYVEIISITGGFALTPRPSVTRSTTASSHSTSSAKTNISSQSALPQANPSTSQSSSPSHVGVIIGPVIGAIGAIALLSLVFIGLYRRKRRPAAESSISPFWETVAPSHPTPPGRYLQTPSTTTGTIPVSAASAAAAATPPVAPQFHHHRGSLKVQRTGTEAVSMGSTGTDTPSHGGSGGSEIQAIRRDVDQLMQIIGRPGSVSVGSPPMYGI